MPSPSLPNEYAVELTPPDISAYREGNTGIPYIWRFEGGEPGPHAMISAIVHGNEPAGAIALDWLMRRDFRPLRGTLTLAFMNVAAYEAFDPADPNATRWVDEDFNRVWAQDVLASDRDSVELRRAREVQPAVAAADRLLDIHTMQHLAPPVMIAGTKPKGVALAREIGVPRIVISDAGHAAGVRMRDHGAFDDPASDASACLIECGQHWEASAGILAKDATARFLVALGMADRDLIAEAGGAEPEPQVFFDVTEAVTIEHGFTFAQAFTGGEIIEKAGTLLGHDGDRAVTTPYDECMLVMPSKRLWPGQTAVRLARRVGDTRD